MQRKTEGKKEPKFERVDNIGSLKTAIGKIKYTDDDEASYLASTDLRFFENDEECGLHASNYDFERVEDVLKKLKSDLGSGEKKSNSDFDTMSMDDLKKRITVLYISGTNLSAFSDSGMPGLKFLNLSDNEQLKTISLMHSTKLEELQAFGCPYLNEVALKKSFSGLKKLDVSNGAINKFSLEETPALEFLNIQSNVIQELNLSGAENLKYLFASKNPIKKITWPKQFDKISIVQIEEWEGMNEALPAILENTDKELKSAINSFLKELDKAEETKITRLKLVFLGNTTVGKSTLRRIFLAQEPPLAAAKEEESSTHGVKIFEKIIKDERNNKVVVQGFDFGGQDYFHSTYRPFISRNALHVLIYGSLSDVNGNWIKDAYHYGKKNVGERTETMYNINYWIGSVRPDELDDRRWTDMEENGENIDSEKEKKKSNIPPAEIIKIELLQNRRKGGPFQELNNYFIREKCGKENVKIGDIIDFDFHNQASEVKKWLVDKVIESAVTVNALETDQILLNWLQNEETEVVYTVQELFDDPDLPVKYDNPEDLRQALIRIHSYNYGYFFRQQEKEDFFIRDLEIFSKWIHEGVLNKDLYRKHNGYFEKEEIEKSTSIIPSKYINDIILFLQSNKIIFKVKGINKDKWVAPSYLPVVESGVEKLFIDSFERPDVIFEFKSFFHSNIILTIIDRFKLSLVKDKPQEKYLLWKNKVLLYQITKNNYDPEEKNKVVSEEEMKGIKTNDEKALLLIELKYPGDADFNGKFPQLTIARNQSAFIKNNKFSEVFEFIMKELKNIEKEVLVKTPFGDEYIPYSCLEQVNTKDKKVRSNLVYYNQTLYSINDFRHFLIDSAKLPTKIFIGYSKYDLEYANELLLHLRPYEKQGEIVIYYDRDLRMGDKWDAELKHQLMNSDIFVCLVSPHLLNTDYVMDLELPLAHDKEVKIAPVIIEDCNWEYLKLNGTGNLLIENQIFDKAQQLPADKSSRQDKWKLIANELVRIPPKSESVEENKSIIANGPEQTERPSTPDEPVAEDHKQDV